MDLILRGVREESALSISSVDTVAIRRGLIRLPHRDQYFDRRRQLQQLALRSPGSMPCPCYPAYERTRQSFDKILRRGGTNSQELHHSVSRDFLHKNQLITSVFYLIKGWAPRIYWRFNRILPMEKNYAITR